MVDKSISMFISVYEKTRPLLDSYLGYLGQVTSRYNCKQNSQLYFIFNPSLFFITQLSQSYQHAQVNIHNLFIIKHRCHCCWNSTVYRFSVRTSGFQWAAVRRCTAYSAGSSGKACLIYKIMLIHYTEAGPLWASISGYYITININNYYTVIQ